MLKFNSINGLRKPKSNTKAIFKQIAHLPFLSAAITLTFSIVSLLTIAAYLLLANNGLIHTKWNENTKILLHFRDNFANEDITKLREQLEKNPAIARVQLVEKEMVLAPKIPLLSPKEINSLNTELKQLPEIMKVVIDTETLLRNLELCKLSDIFMMLLFWSLLIHWLLVVFGASYLTAKTLNRKLNIAKTIIPKQFLIYGLGSGMLAIAGIMVIELLLRDHNIYFNGLGIIEGMVAIALLAMVAYLAAKTAATVS